MSKLFFRSALILCLGSWSASAAFAQQVSLTLNNGRVTLKATNATVRQILDEWARVGGTKIVNGDKVGGQPVTLTLVDEPEGQALETVLRSAAGYMVAERANPAPNGSRFERIMLMGRTTPVTASASSNNNAYTANGPMPPGGTFQAEGPVTADDDGDPPQPQAPVVNPYAQAAPSGAPGTVTPANANGVPGMGTGLGQQQAAAAAAAQQQGVQPNPGYSNVYGQQNLGPASSLGAAGAQSGTVQSGTAQSGGVGTVSTGVQPEVKFDYANPQKYFQQRGQQNTSSMQPYPGVPLSPTAQGTGTGTATGSNPGTGAAGTITPTTPANQNPYSPNFNPYNLPAGGGVPTTTPGTVSSPTPVEPDRAKYANPYVQPAQQPQQQP